MADLINWSITEKNDKYYLHGNVSGHSKLPNGMYVNTTSGKQFEVTDTALNIQTKNTLYTLPLGRICADSLRDGRSVILKLFGQDVLDKIINAAKDEQRCITERINNVLNRIDNDTVYLAFSSDIEYYFDLGIHKGSDGTVAAIEKCVHIGMLQDSVLLQSNRATLCSYFPHADNKIEFCGNSDDESHKQGQLLGYIANTGEKAIKITFTWGGSALLAAGEEITVVYGMAENIGDD